MNPLTNGYTTGLDHTLTAAGWTLGAATVLGPWTLAAILLHRTWHTLTTTRPAWWLRTRRSIHRHRRGTIDR